MAVLGSIGGFGRAGGVLPRSPFAPRIAPVFKPAAYPTGNASLPPGVASYPTGTPPFMGAGLGAGFAPGSGPAGTPGSSAGLQSSISFGGYTPDYNSLIRADPSYMATHNAIQAMLAKAEARKNSAIGQLRYDYGDPVTAGSNNPDSFVARNYRNLRQQQADNLRQLAARGALRSLETPYLENQAQEQFKSADYDASKALAQAIQQQVYGYQDTLDQGAQSEAQAIAQAYQNLQGNPLYQARTPTSAQLVTDWSKYGEPVYKDANGNIWTQSGYPWQPRPGYPGA